MPPLNVTNLEAVMTDDDGDPFERGKLAAFNKQPIGTNPYQDGTEQFSLWSAGYEVVQGASSTDTQAASDTLA
jgi:hypothetical protein